MKKRFKLLFSGLLLPAFILSSCQASNNENLLNKKFVYANFESYMSPKLMSKIRNENTNLQFDFVSSNENLMTNFKNKTYTIGTASTYAVIDLIEQGILQPIDWTKFNLSYLNDENELIKINNANDALGLFTDQVQQILTSYSIKNQPINLLEYSVPYFFQSFVFAYRGEVIDQLVDHQSNWSDIIKTISSDQYKDRFSDNKLGIVEDERSIYSVANLIKTQNDAQPTVNPLDTQIQTNDFSEVYQYIASAGLNANNFVTGTRSTALLNSDSAVILNNLASKRINGAIMFNGDAIYAAQGGEFLKDEDKPTSEDFHIVTPKQTPLALDLITINKLNIDQYPELLNQSYDVIKQVALEGVDQTNDDFVAEVEDSDPDDPEYKYGPLDNFNFVQYTSPLRKISQPETGIVDEQEWFDETNSDEIKALQTQNKEKQEEIRKLQSEIESLQNDLNNNQLQDELTAEQQDQIEQKIQTLIEKLEQLTNELKELTTHLTNLRQQLQKAEDNKKLSELIKSAYYIKDIKNVNNFIEAPINDLQKASLINAYVRFKETSWK
ncbi:spermidine/putrescine ABC transporter substrate-binding protein [Mycoplasma sp. E35C]|uniref:spermidine/putrescine ABC transporter substrate-binding protein n=1 Tax=Mycoplasma sp. E35C TaxID=2801918 RepID=UPI001CA3AE47|nr:spermidine/putrescine ABC transporter substrate-binding protein [Mycoplasma sp. E35C]QZX48892.1 spermidine/putrescine ABC transporter substrate-binding protein [Mycoplasma sp. E35C]